MRQQPQSPIASGLTSRVLMRRRTSLPWPFSQGASFSGGKKNGREFALGPLEDAALVAFQAKEIIAAQLLRDEARALLLAMQRVGGDHGVVQRGLDAFEQLAGDGHFAVVLGSLMHGHGEGRSKKQAEQAAARAAVLALAEGGDHPTTEDTLRETHHG